MKTNAFAWAIIGAGPAGIAAVGKLLDFGVKPQEIAWIDPAFAVGDFGTKWRKVSSNTKVDFFLKFLNHCAAFRYNNSPHFALKHADPSQTCLLEMAAEPLQWVTTQLMEQVQPIFAKAQHLKLYDRHWHITLENQQILAKNVVLATGSEPKSLSFPGVIEIPLDIALNPDKLKLTCDAEDVIAVFGASHSAIIILKALIENCSVKKVINFYLSPLRYAVYLDDWILFDDTGLKGNAATWARTYIDGILPTKLTRVISSEELVRTTLPLCNKAIYATGFQKRLIPIEGMYRLDYNDRSGIIAPGLFGLGIAFPEAKIDPYGTLEYRVGLWKFMDYLHKIMPVWLKYSA